MKTETKGKISIIISMAIFGTIGLFVKFIPLPSSVIAAVRGFIGAAFLIVAMLLAKKGFSFKAVRNNLVLLVLSGAAIGINWILLFEAYRHTTVSVATLCYYMAPVFVTAFSPIILKEALTLKKGICITVALIGMVLVSGVLNGAQALNATGIFFGLGAAVFYATVIFLNKFLKDISPLETTVVQLFAAAVTALPYVLIVEDLSDVKLGALPVILLIIVGIVHTGIAYWLYFGSFRNLKAQSVAVISYVDPALAIVLSALILREPIGVPEIIGAVLILGSTLICEIL